MSSARTTPGDRAATRGRSIESPRDSHHARAQPRLRRRVHVLRSRRRAQVDTEGLLFSHELSDIESLNRRAMAGELDVTAVSFHAYAYLADRYLLLPHGASFGDGYGPVVVARSPIAREEIAAGSVPVASPGKWTTAALALSLWAPGVRDRGRCLSTRSRSGSPSGELDAGVLIHEGQLTFLDEGLVGGRRPRPLVEGGDGPSAAARRKRRAARPRAPTGSAASPGRSGGRSSSVSPTGKTPSPTPSRTRGGSIGRAPIGSSRCTSTSGRADTGRREGGPCRRCSTGRPREGRIPPVTAEYAPG